MVESLYELNRICDNPMYEGLAGLDDPSVLGRSNLQDDFFTVDAGWNWRLEALRDRWKEPVMTGRVASFNDYPCINLIIPAFSVRAVGVLRDFLEPNGELLPVRHPTGRFFAFHCLKIVEILDQSNCVARWFDGDDSLKQALDIKIFSIKPNSLEGLSLFRFREMSTGVFVTNEIVERVKSNGLNGFDFKKIWPFPEGVKWRDEAIKLRRARGQKVITEDGSREIKGQSMVISFPWAGEKLAKDEKKLISSFQDALDAQLVVHNMDDPYFGSLEGRKSKKGQTLLFLSCPDTQRLFRKLLPWLKSIEWHVPPKIYLREVPFDDFLCDGTLVDVGSI